MQWRHLHVEGFLELYDDDDGVFSSPVKLLTHLRPAYLRGNREMLNMMQSVFESSLLNIHH